jgi:hypothetical protein
MAFLHSLFALLFKFWDCEHFGTSNRTGTNAHPMIFCIWHSAVVWEVGTNISEEYSAYIFKDEVGVPKKNASLNWWCPSTSIPHCALTQKTTKWIFTNKKTSDLIHSSILRSKRATGSKREWQNGVYGSGRVVGCILHNQYSPCLVTGLGVGIRWLAGE